MQCTECTVYRNKVPSTADIKIYTNEEKKRKFMTSRRLCNCIRAWDKKRKMEEGT